MLTDEQKNLQELKEFESKVIKIATMENPGKSCFTKEYLDTIRAKLKKSGGKVVNEVKPKSAPKPKAKSKKKKTK